MCFRLKCSWDYEMFLKHASSASAFYLLWWVRMNTSDSLWTHNYVSVIIKEAKKENLVSKGSPLIFLPKRKLNLEKSDISSPSKRSKFQDTRHFWKSMQGDNNSNKIVPGFKTTSSLVTELASGSETNKIIDSSTD